MDEQARRRFERWQLESLAGGDTAKAGLFGKTLGLLGLDADGNRAATSWTDAAKHTAGNLINAPQDIGNQLLDLQDYQPVYGTGASNPEDRARAGQQAVSTFGLAGLAPLGGMAVGKMAGVSPIENNAAGVFGGRLARTADHQKLATAEEMAAKGVPREQIWNETGWFTGADGKWRFEIDDSGASLGSGATLGQALSHKPLMNAYPSIRDYEFDVRPLGRKQYGAFSPGDAPSGLPPSVSVSSDGKSGLSSTLHEVQHGIQADEGFSKGANQFGMSPEAVKIYKDIRKRMATPMSLDEWATSQFDGNVEAARASYKDYRKTAGKVTPQLDRIAQETAVEQAYRRSAGETEARAVQTRLPLTADQRAARPPWLDYDVPENQQIVRLYANSKEGASPGLAMDHASRMQRARELGYDPDTTLYHGTNKEFDSFDTGKSGSGVGTAGQSATWLTPSPAEASAWAKVTGGGNGDRVLPVHTRMTNPKIISSSELTQLRIPSKPDTLAYNSKVFEAELEKARAAGHDGVVFKNVDEGFAHGAQDQIAVFDPSNIRSKFAAFDPAQSHSPNLLASNAREGAVPGLGITAQSEQNDPYRTALQMQARRKMLGLPD